MTTRSILRPHKDEVVAERAAVATAHPIASQVGIDVLRQGGNAVDAAVATGFCLAVVEPWNSCIAGHGEMLVHMAASGRSVALDYGHRAPRAATPDMFTVIGQAEQGNGIYEVEGRANAAGYLAVGVPGNTAGMCKAHELFGTLPLEQLMEPAVHYAQEGFEADSVACLLIAGAMADLVTYGEGANIFLSGGYPPGQGVDRIVQRDLAETLRRIARDGRDALYKGELPHAIEEDMKRNRGLLRVEDFTDYRVQVSEPARTTYRGYELLGSPVPGGTTTEFQTMSILESFDMGTLAHNTGTYLHIFIEAARHAFADRYRYLGDPDFGPVPLDGMLSRDYAREIAGTIDLERAALEGDREHQPWVAFADEALHDPWRYDPQPSPQTTASASPPSVGDCTTHFGVIDGDRNMVACTQTAVNGFGSRVVVPGTGVLLTNGMAVFNPMPGAANSIAGYKRGLHNMGPLLVLRDGKPFLSIGAPGGRKIMDCVAQVLMNVIDHGMGIQEAITAPRVDAADRETFVDGRMDDAVVQALRTMGHHVEVTPVPPALKGFASPRGLMVDPDTGKVHAGVDVFSTSEARGF